MRLFISQSDSRAPLVLRSAATTRSHSPVRLNGGTPTQASAHPYKVAVRCSTDTSTNVSRNTQYEIGRQSDGLFLSNLRST